MSEFSANSLWNRLAFLFTHLSFGTFLFAFTYQAWAAANLRNFCVDCSEELVEFMFVVGYICVLLAVVLVECLSLLDEVRGNKGALIAFIIFVLVAGFCVIVADAYYMSEVISNTAIYSNTDTMVCGLLAVLAGIFGILDICGVKSN